MIFVCQNCSKRRRLKPHKYKSGHFRCRKCLGPIVPDYTASFCRNMQLFSRATQAAMYSVEEFGNAVRQTFLTAPEPDITADLKEAVRALGPAPEPVAFLLDYQGYQAIKEQTEPREGMPYGFGVELYVSPWLRPGIAFKGHPDKIRRLVEMLEYCTSQEVADKIIALFEEKEPV